jgi:hypothetical protein
MFCTKKREICVTRKGVSIRSDGIPNWACSGACFHVAYLMSVNRSSAARNLSYSSTEFIVVIWCLLGPLGIVVAFRVSSFIGAAVIYVLVRSNLVVNPLGFVTTKPDARLIVYNRRRIFLIIIIMVKSDRWIQTTC